MGSHASRAVVCPGHAVYLSGDVYADTSWVLQPFQAGEPPYYIGHLKRAVELAALDSQALLVLSGGVTRREAGPKSEAQGYLEVAQSLDWFGHPEVQERTLLEDFSRDSFENLLFSICAFRVHQGSYPEQVTIAGWTFKEERFHLHAQAIGFPADRLTYIGVNTPADLEKAIEGERRAVLEFLSDPLGAGVALQEKRKQRNPFDRQQNYARWCPEMAPFLGTIAVTPRRYEPECLNDFRT